MAFFPAELIKKKRDGGTHSREEIDFLVHTYSRGELPDYQMAAWLMAALLKGLSNEETHLLTQAMLHSGQVMNFSDIPIAKVDKHSTGGVGDKTSMILGPIVAAAGLAVPMISGRGLAHTGGTLDKLESIPGFSTRLDEKKFRTVLKKTGLCFMGQTDSICPADKKIYSLRDVTATVESTSLICASIMSKKLAEGIEGLVLDVKYGNGAFMKTEESAERLARALMDIGIRGGKKVHALITNMDQPLGRLAGNALEVAECVAILKDEPLAGVQDTRELSILLSAHMLILGGRAKDLASARVIAEETLASGKAFEKFEESCREQGGNLSALPKAKQSKPLLAEKSGFLESFDTEAVGYAGIALGAGRLAASDELDLTAGMEFHKKIGDSVSRGEPLCTVYGNDSSRFEEGLGRLKRAIHVSPTAAKPKPLLHKTLTNL